MNEPVKAASDTTEPDNFQVYADPAGHPLCLCWVKGLDLGPLGLGTEVVLNGEVVGTVD